MACKKEGVPFSGTPEQEAALKKVIAELKDTKGALMPIMQQAQEIYGYLPIEVQTMISDETGIPLEKIYGIATFYTQFALQPKGKYQISVCLGTACYVKGAADVLGSSYYTRTYAQAEKDGKTEIFYGKTVPVTK